MLFRSSFPSSTPSHLNGTTITPQWDHHHTSMGPPSFPNGTPSHLNGTTITPQWDRHYFSTGHHTSMGPPSHLNGTTTIPQWDHQKDAATRIWVGRPPSPQKPAGTHWTPPRNVPMGPWWLEGSQCPPSRVPGLGHSSSEHLLGFMGSASEGFTPAASRTMK